MIVGLVFGLATGVGLGFAIKYFVDGWRPKPHKDNKVNHQEKEYFCPDCRTFRTEQGVHISARLVDLEESSLWGLKKEIMCLNCGQKNVDEWNNYLKMLVRDGRLGTDRIEQIEARITAIEKKLAAQEAEAAEQLGRLKNPQIDLSDIETGSAYFKGHITGREP